MIEQVYAGHAGEAGTVLLMPHEIMEGLAILGGAVFLLALVIFWCLWRLHRRAQALERRLGLHNRSDAPKA